MLPLTLAQRIAKLSQSGKIRNVLALIVALGLGQGSLFLAQTYLLSQGQAAFMGTLGIALLIVSLLVQVIDWGGQLLVARAYLNNGLGNARTTLFAFFVVRALVLLVFCAAYLVIDIYHLVALSPFAHDFLLTSGLSLVFLTFNISGMLDGMQKAGMNGPVTSLPFVLVALALFFTRQQDLTHSGYFLGLMYSLGTLTGLVMQYASFFRHVALKRFLFEDVDAPGPGALRDAFLDGGSYTLTMIPGQLFFRAQVFGLAYLGLKAIGTFIYAKQLTNISSMIAQFARRAELATYTSDKRPFTLKSLFRYISFTSALVITAGLMVLALMLAVFASYLPRDASGVLAALLWLAPTVVTSAAAGVISIWYTLHHGPRLPAAIMSITSLLGIAILLCVRVKFGYSGVAICEMMVHLSQMWLLITAVKIKGPEGQLLPATQEDL